MVENVTDPKQLFQYFEFSGLRTTPEDWLDLAIKLSGTTLNLYRVDLISNKALNDYLNYSPREKMNDCEEARLRALKDGEYADFSSL